MRSHRRRRGRGSERGGKRDHRDDEDDGSPLVPILSGLLGISCFCLAAVVGLLFYVRKSRGVQSIHLPAPQRSGNVVVGRPVDAPAASAVAGEVSTPVIPFSGSTDAGGGTAKDVD